MTASRTSAPQKRPAEERRVSAADLVAAGVREEDAAAILDQMYGLATAILDAFERRDAADAQG